CARYGRPFWYFDVW
nr:immunoglobulin heavy chain junction region [Mus musculus]MBK4197682.1 immunoglobulin heavy chain junction region [Mus musculus]MBK4197683.1 immunoglobulin heavy chain junction region [Mus musculus]MBK4197684.1 immunoglobulin heavy chain junction region [Mus musculus]MBK4197685.1 immunoglobulin heavy chain junction region [Mus musculus]